MAEVELDYSELLAFPAEVEIEAKRVAEKAYPLVAKVSEKLQRDWRRNARGSSGKHGVHYPSSITREQRFSTDGPDWEVGPDSSLPQGGMGRGFEFGSVNQPPHNDMGEAMPQVEAALDAGVKKILDEFLS